MRQSQHRFAGTLCSRLDGERYVKVLLFGQTQNAKVASDQLPPELRLVSGDQSVRLYVKIEKGELWADDVVVQPASIALPSPPPRRAPPPPPLLAVASL